MKKIIMLLISCIPFASYAQWQWAKQFGGYDNDGGGAGFTDANNNLYLYGTFNLNFYSQTDTLVSNGVHDYFLSKLDPNGNELWIKGFGGPNPTGFYENGGFSSLDNTGNYFYISGSYYSTLTIDAFTVTSSQGIDIFLAKFDLSGNCIWLKSAGGFLEDRSGGFVVTTNGDIIITGTVSNVAQFDSFTVQPGGFIAKYDSNGNCLQAAQKFSGILFGCIKFIGNDIVATGTASNDTIIIDTTTIYKTGAVLTKLDVNGNVIWAKAQDGNSETYGIFLDVDNQQNIYWSGRFNLNASFDGNAISNGNYDFFLIKYNSSGTFQWVEQSNATGIGGAFGGMVESDGDGNVYLAGFFGGNAQFGTFSITANTSADFFVARYATNSDCMGIRNFGVASGGGVITDNIGSVIVSGQFINTITIGTQNLTSVNGSSPDIFIAKADEITGIGEGKFAENNTLLIYANPNAGKCNITVPDDFLHEKKLTLSIYNNAGKLIQQKTLEMNEGKIKLNLEAEAKGIYNVTLSNGIKNYNGKIVFE